MEPIDIVINNFRRLQYLDILVKIIKERTQFPYRIIVVDNCSTSKTKDFIENLKKDGYIWKAVYNKENYILPQAFKRGFELVESEYCILTVDDIVLPYSNPCWLTHLNYLIRNNPDYGAICFRHGKSSSIDYFKKNIEMIDYPLKNIELEPFYAIEEFLQIQKTDDLKKIPFSLKSHCCVREFGRNVRRILGKRVGKPSKDFLLRTVIWRDKNLGYEDNLPERGKFEL
jgi:glycosyltransferase involved in cell wall biosynthesis